MELSVWRFDVWTSQRHLHVNHLLYILPLGRQLSGTQLQMKEEVPKLSVV